MKDLDFPSQSIPFEFLDGLLAGLDGQVGDQPPLDLLSIVWGPTLIGMNDHQGQRGISVLFSDWRQNSNRSIPDLENGLIRIAVSVSHFDAMQSLDCDLIHLVGDRVTSISSQAVDARSNQEMRSDLLCGAEKLIDVTLAITNMQAPSGITQELRGLLFSILLRWDALLLLDGNSRRVDPFLPAQQSS